MIKNISYVFQNTPKTREFLELLRTLLGSTKFGSVGLYPVTEFLIADVQTPEIRFDGRATNLLSRGVGATPRFKIAEIAHKLRGHIKRVDHTGVNLTATAEQWDEKINEIAKQTALYKYPTGEPWFFIVPHTPKEFKTDITDFTKTRDPKFEIVNDEDGFAIQIDIETDLTKTETEKLFPLGVSFDTLGDVFRAIYVDFDDFCDVRLDLRFKCEHNDWESGEWLVKSGGRRRVARVTRNK